MYIIHICGRYLHTDSGDLWMLCVALLSKEAREGWQGQGKSPWPQRG